MERTAACKIIRAHLKEINFGTLIWLDLDSSVRRPDPEQERKARRWRRLIKEEWARRDALKAETE